LKFSLALDACADVIVIGKECGSKVSIPHENGIWEAIWEAMWGETWEETSQNHVQYCLQADTCSERHAHRGLHIYTKLTHR
jgi:hypothetical protein